MHLQSYSTDSIYLLQRSVRDEGDERLPLRDAVEKRPISLIEPESAFKLIEVIKVHIVYSNVIILKQIL